MGLTYQSPRHSWLRWPSGTADDIDPTGAVVTRADMVSLVSSLHRSPLEARQWVWQTGVNPPTQKQAPLPSAGIPPARETPAERAEREAYRNISSQRRKAIRDAKRAQSLKAKEEIAEEMAEATRKYEEERVAKYEARVQQTRDLKRKRQEARLNQAFDETTTALGRLLRSDPTKLFLFITKVLGENQAVLGHMTPAQVKALIRAGLTENNLAYARWVCGLEWRSWETLAVIKENTDAEWLSAKAAEAERVAQQEEAARQAYLLEKARWQAEQRAFSEDPCFDLLEETAQKLEEHILYSSWTQWKWHAFVTTTLGFTTFEDFTRFTGGRPVKSWVRAGLNQGNLVYFREVCGLPPVET